MHLNTLSNSPLTNCVFTRMDKSLNIQRVYIYYYSHLFKVPCGIQCSGYLCMYAKESTVAVVKCFGALLFLGSTRMAFVTARVKLCIISLFTLVT